MKVHPSANWSLAIVVLLLLLAVTSSAEDPVDEETAYYAKLLMAENRSLALPGTYIVVFNESLVEDLGEAINEIRSQAAQDDENDDDDDESMQNTTGRLNISISVEQQFPRLKMAIISVGLNDDIVGEEDETLMQARRTKLRSWLRSVLVDIIEEDTIFMTQEDQGSLPWGLDRIDQTDLPLNNTYHYDYSGANVTAFILDTGIRDTHEDIRGRADCQVSFVPGQECADGNGHGSHVAGIIGGTRYGMAKSVTLIGVKVLSNKGSGSNSRILAGLAWVLDQALSDPDRPMVANLSLGGMYSFSLNLATNVIVKGGVFMSVAAGNSDVNACLSSPASGELPLAVGSVDQDDRRSEFSNKGGCVEIFAPGSEITSIWYDSDTATSTISGTSMASPHVAGAAALFLEANPMAGPLEIRKMILDSAVKDMVQDVGSQSPHANAFYNTNHDSNVCRKS